MSAHAPISAAPGVPPAPAPRVAWEAPAPHHLRAVARDWEDGHPATYQIEALHRRHWQPATGEETTQAHWLLLAAWDQRADAPARD